MFKTKYNQWNKDEKKKMKITFCLPNHNYKSPIGGYKMVYEYANRLLERGHSVNIVFCTKNSLKKYPLPSKVKNILSKYIVSKSPKWFNLDKRVNKIAADEISDDFIPKADIVIATAAQTALPISMLSKDRGKKVYFIQDYENWVVSERELLETYKLGMINITVSKWLYEIVSKYQEKNTYCIQNPIDIDVYRVHEKVEERNKFYIGMLYHEAEYKGCKYALEAICNLKKRYKEIELLMFGNPELPTEYKLDWIHYTQHASVEQVVKIYNSCAIFVCASVEEGFGLTGLESMACGCAFVTTGYRGVYEYAENNKNALISPVKNTSELERNIERMLMNDDLRIRISKQANIDAQKYSWERALRLFEMHTSS